METLRDLDLVRAVPACVELRAAEGDAGDTLGTMVGHFSVFDTWYPIRSFWEGDFMESIAPGAFRKTMSERRSQIVVAFDHGYDPQIGDKVLGTIQDIREEQDAAVGDVALFDTSYVRDLLPGLEAGVYGSSMRMRVVKEAWNDEPGASPHNPNRLPERTILEARLFEFGPVTWPANPSATAGVRSMTDDYYERLRSRDPQRVEELTRMREARTLEREAAGDATAPDGAAPNTDEPGDAHSGGPTFKQRRERAYPNTLTKE